jgi:outer membrane protein TolC
LSLCLARSAAALLTLAGCAHYEPRPLAPSESAAALEGRSLTNAEFLGYLGRQLPSGTNPTLLPPTAWDVDLLTLAAIYYQPAVGVARAQWRITGAEHVTAAGRRNPTVNLGPGYNSDSFPGVTPWMPFITFDMPIETAGKRGFRMERAAYLGEAARLNLASAVWQARAAIRGALFDLKSAEQRERLLGGHVETQERINELLRQRVEMGVAAKSEMTLWRIALERSRLERLDARRLAAEARSRLAEAIGVPPWSLETLGFSTQSPEKTGALPKPARPGLEVGLNRVELRRAALQRRADILALLAEYSAAESNLKLELAKQYPDLHINPGFVWDQGESKWQLGIGMELPLLNRNQGPIAEAKARREETGARFLALQARVLAEIERAAQGWDLARAHVAQLTEVAQALAKQQDMIQAQVNAGAAERLDLLNAQLEYYTSELARAEGAIRLDLARGALEDVWQQPFPGADAIFKPIKADERN